MRLSDCAVRMNMGELEAVGIREVLDRCGPNLQDVADRLLDQLWLRTALVEQRRRMRIAERPAFDERADRVLEALDPQEPASWPSAPS